MPRTERKIVTLPGIGGYIQPYQPTASELNTPGVRPSTFANQPKLEVFKWSVRHEFRLADITHSGSNGAIQRTLVAQDFDCTFEIPWNSSLAESKSKIGFVQNLLVGGADAEYNVSIFFAMGDPLSYLAAGAGGTNRHAGLFADKILISEITTICDSTGTDVIRIDCKAMGNSLLQGYRGEEQQFNFNTSWAT